MGIEYITQPQVFLAPITAASGFQGAYQDWPLLTSFQSWVSTGTVNASAFPIPGNWTMLDNPSSFIVTVGNVIQSPTDYTIDKNNRILTFSSAVSAGIEIGVTQLATAAPSSQNFNTLYSLSAFIPYISGGNGILDSLLVQNLTALGSLTYLDTQVVITSAMSVTNTGTGPALTVNQTGSQPIANFLDDGTTALFVADGGNVGIKTNVPNQPLTVIGNISATNTVYAPTILTNSVGISCTPNQTLTVNGNISATGGIFSNNTFIYTNNIINSSNTTQTLTDVVSVALPAAGVYDIRGSLYVTGSGGAASNNASPGIASIIYANSQSGTSYLLECNYGLAGGNTITRKASAGKVFGSSKNSFFVSNNTVVSSTVIDNYIHTYAGYITITSPLAIIIASAALNNIANTIVLNNGAYISARQIG